MKDQNNNGMFKNTIKNRLPWFALPGVNIVCSTAGSPLRMCNLAFVFHRETGEYAFRNHSFLPGPHKGGS